jgi:CDP-diacylglycerol--glycerol-3-phosphate 3-phosphatidyltransferase
MLTVAGLLPAVISALFAASGNFLAAGLVLLVGAPFDALDGAVARAMNKVSRFGAFLDSTTDRYSEGFLFAGIAYFYAGQGDAQAVGLAFLALIGSFAVSYTRARAEGLDVGSIKDGLFDRVVRTLVLIGTLLTGWIVPGLVVLVIGTHLTALQRILIARRALQNDPPAA